MNMKAVVCKGYGPGGIGQGAGAGKLAESAPPAWLPGPMAQMAQLCGPHTKDT
jgi:hypothetical protein